MTLKNWVIDEMIDNLNEMEDCEVYGCDLGYEIFSDANYNGSYTCSTHDAIEWIGKHFQELGEVVEEIEFSLGKENICNPFLEPEKFMVICMLELSATYIAQCKIIDENWNNSLELTAETIKQITKELETMKD